jgi:hypothetical protein
MATQLDRVARLRTRTTFSTTAGRPMPLRRKSPNSIGGGKRRAADRRRAM